MYYNMRHNVQLYGAMKSQKTVSVYFLTGKILPFGSHGRMVTIVGYTLTMVNDFR